MESGRREEDVAAVARRLPRPRSGLAAAGAQRARVVSREPPGARAQVAGQRLDDHDVRTGCESGRGGAGSPALRNLALELRAVARSQPVRSRWPRDAATGLVREPPPAILRE